MSSTKPEALQDAVNEAPTELIERLRGTGGDQLRNALLDQLSAIDQRLTQEAGTLQSTLRMKQIEAARLAVQNASAILTRLSSRDEQTPADGAVALQTLFRSHSHDQ